MFSFYMFSLIIMITNTNYKIEMHYNPSLSIAGKRDIGWRISGGTAGDGNLGGRYGPDDLGE